MNREILINKTISNISLLPDWRIKEVADYVDFLIKLDEEKQITKSITKLTSGSGSFDFLEEEEELYGEQDIIE